MTQLQKLILDALDQLGTMTAHELETACLIEPSRRGGFQSSLGRLFDCGFVEVVDATYVRIKPEGVRAIEADNIAHEAEPIASHQ